MSPESSTLRISGLSSVTTICFMSSRSSEHANLPGRKSQAREARVGEDQGLIPYGNRGTGAICVLWCQSAWSRGGGAIGGHQACVLFQQAGSSPDVDGSLHLVPRQHPDLDACLGKPVDGLRDLKTDRTHEGGRMDSHPPNTWRCPWGTCLPCVAAGCRALLARAACP